MMNKNILITGADGFIGSHLTELLVNENFHVRAFVYYNSFNSNGWLDSISPEIKNKIEFFSGDIRDPNGVREAMKGVDIVFHLAALIAIPFSYHSPDSYIDTNVKGTLNILQAARDNNVSRVIVTSTSEVYGTAQFVPITELHPKQPQSPYSASKIGADSIAESFYRSFNLPVTILEPKISTLNCGSIVVNPKDVGSKLDYSGVVTISYQGGNNKKSYPVNISSSVVKGLTLKADSILLNKIGGTLTLSLSGTPDTAGIAIFPLTIGEKTCNVMVKVIDSEIKIPNVFTPNEDGKNDLWSIPALAFKPESKVLIFDRLGRLLIEYPGSSPGWNGLVNNYPATAGDYWYVIQISKDAAPLKGNFTLLR